MLDTNFDISGKWFNKRTGETVNVRNSIMDGDKLLIMTEKGVIPAEIFMDEYIQVSEDMFNEAGEKIGNSEITNDDFKIENNNVQTNFTKPEINLETTAFDNLTNISNDNLLVEAKKNKYDEAIVKFFSKIKTKPEINIFIKWNDFPFDKLNTLIEYLDIEQDSVISYIKENYLQNDEELTNSIKNTFFNNSEDEES